MSATHTIKLAEEEIRRLESLVAADPIRALIGGPQQNAALLALALTKQVLTQAKAAVALLKVLPPESAMPNTRSFLEAFGELHYLLSSADPETEALIAHYFAVLEIIRASKTQGATDSELQEHIDDLARLDDSLPAVGIAARKRRNFWTAKPRAELVYEAFLTTRDPAKAESHPDYGRLVYKLLSWDEHHVTSLLSAVDRRPESPGFGRVTESHPWPDLDELLALIIAGSVREVRGRLEAYCRTPRGPV